MSSLLDLISQLLALSGLEKEVDLSMRQKVSNLMVEILKNKTLSKIIDALSLLFSKCNLMRVTLKCYAKAIDDSPMSFKLFITTKMSEKNISQLKMATAMDISHTKLGGLLDMSKEIIIKINEGLEMMDILSLTDEERYWGFALLLRDNNSFKKLKVE